MAATATTEPSVLVEHLAPGVVKIVLNRPKALNALNVELLDRFVDALRVHAFSAKVLIIEGAGDRAFCAGEDLKQTLAPLTGTAPELRHAFDKLQDITRLTAGAPAVVIAAVQGYAIGGGAEIALAADIVVGGPGARFRFPEVPIGHAHTGGITLRLVPLVGLLRAKELLLTGRWVGAEEAAKLGLLTELVADDAKARATELALALAQQPGTSMSMAKAVLERSVFPNNEANLQDEVNVASYCFAQSDAAKAFSDFQARKAGSGERGASAKAVAKQETEETGGSKQGKITEKSAEQTVVAAAAPTTPIRDINTAWQRALATWPDRTILRFGGQDYTFAGLDATVGQVAGGLRQAGIRAGDRVLVLMRNSVEMVVSWLAANRLGAVWVPINVELRSVSLQHVVEAAEAQLAIVDAEFVDEFRAHSAFASGSLYVRGEAVAGPGDDAKHTTNGHPWRDFGSLVSGLPVPARDAATVYPDTTAGFLYTSGTTGRSKPCILSHEYFILQAQALIDSCALRGDDVLYCPFPLFHADATALTLIPAILLGAVAALSVRFSASRFWDEIRAADATIYDFMGATLALTYKQPPTPRDREHRVRLAWGVPIPSFAADYEARFGHRLITLYGSVEASIPIFQPRHPDTGLPVGVPNSCGRVRPGHQIRIVDSHDEEVPPNTTGHLLLRSDAPNAFFQGYFNAPDSTASSFRGLWLHSGDLARVDADGNVFFAGRVKDVIRRRGENVNASEVEEELLEHPDVVLAAAYGVPSALGEGTEEDVKVAVQVRPGSSLDEKTLWAWAAGRMARFQVPSVIEFVDRIKKTPTGKIEKGALPQEGGHRFDIRSMQKAG